jgi:aspartyl-tRNA(Asn)/glutamyl-tRNA(Gln) amidotransferase subunit C
MKIDTNSITKFAAISKLELTEEEKTEFKQQLTDIVKRLNKLNELDTTNVKPTEQVLDLKNVFREDIVHPSMNTKEIAKTAPAFEDNMFVVPQIIE